MTDAKKTMQGTVRVPQRVPGFDPMKLARETAGKAGEKVLTLDLKHKKAWFRMACPNGGMVLNPLRVTDQMAIFEARLFADTEDRNPLASFTATRAADKATGKQYIQAAQEDALNEALETAGFGLPLIPMANFSGQEAPPAVQKEVAREPAGGGQPVEAPPVAEPKQGAEPVVQAAENAQAVPEKAPPVEPLKAEDKPAPRPAPAGPPPRAAETPRPAPVGPQPHFQRVVETTGAHSVVDIATAKVAEGAVQSATQQSQSGAAAQPAADTEPVPSAPTGEDVPVTYNADMTVEEITRLMTLEQAKKIKVQDGTCKGWTLEQVAADRPPSLKWLKFTAPFADNVVKAAAGIVLADLELKKAG